MTNNKNLLKVLKTGDNSLTVYNATIDENYHSIHGALQESMHVFITNGFCLSDTNPLNVLEVGLGTGLNAALTCIEATSRKIKVNYTGLEPFPLGADIVSEVLKGYKGGLRRILKLIHDSPKETVIDSYFYFSGLRTTIQNYEPHGNFDIIYYDAFSPDKQPHMWTTEVFERLYNCLIPGGFITTYCAKGQVKRNMRHAGLLVKTTDGPPGKREMSLGYRI